MKKLLQKNLNSCHYSGIQFYLYRVNSGKFSDQKYVK